MSQCQHIDQNADPVGVHEFLDVFAVHDEFVQEQDESVSLMFICALQDR